MECENNAGVESALNVAIEGLKANKERDGYANKAMSDAIGEIAKLRKKCIKLEQSNGELRERLAQTEEELDDWKGNAEGFQPDEYMKLPLDADGVPIRIGDEMWLKCAEAEEPLKRIVFGYRASASGELTLFIGRAEGKREGTCLAQFWSHKKPEQADSWEKLEEDAMQHACFYFGIDSENASCEDCPRGQRLTGRVCWQNARLDMIARAKKLAGIEEEGER